MRGMIRALKPAAPLPARDPHSVVASLESFVRWLRRAGYTSYDQYDFWATAYGIWSKGVILPIGGALDRRVRGGR